MNGLQSCIFAIKQFEEKAGSNNVLELIKGMKMGLESIIIHSRCFTSFHLMSHPLTWRTVRPATQETLVSGIQSCIEDCFMLSIVDASILYYTQKSHLPLILEMNPNWFDFFNNWILTSWLFEYTSLYSDLLSDFNDLILS